MKEKVKIGFDIGHGESIGVIGIINKEEKNGESDY